jgi:hypothetical protein
MSGQSQLVASGQMLLAAHTQSTGLDNFSPLPIRSGLTGMVAACGGYRPSNMGRLDAGSPVLVPFGTRFAASR